MCGIRPTRPRHSDADDTGWICLQRAHITCRRIRLLVLHPLLGLGVLLRPLIQELPRPLPVKGSVFDDGLLLPAFTAIGTFRVERLGLLPLLLPSEISRAGPDPLPTFIPLRGPRPLNIDLSTFTAMSSHPLGLWCLTEATLSHSMDTGAGF